MALQMRLRTVSVFLVIGIVLFCFQTGEAKTIYVGASEKYKTIRAGIKAAVNGDWVIVRDGTYTGVGNGNIRFMGKAITVKSENGPAQCIVDGEGTRKGFIFNKKERKISVLSGFTIRNCKGEYGGGIYCSHSSPTVTKCMISKNSADCGAGIYCYSSSPDITNCRIGGNSAGKYGGGGISCDLGSSPEITNCTISENSVEYVWGGGGIQGGAGISCHRDSSPKITNCTVWGNSAHLNPGGIYCNGSSPTITKCRISKNSRGGIYCDQGSSPRITNCTITENSTDFMGGGIMCSLGSSPTIRNCRITGNSADSLGGGIMVSFPDSSPTITDCTISGNSANSGGGISSAERATPIITNCTISGNSACCGGGGISCFLLSSPTITNCTITGNSADQGGGFYRDGGSPTITNCILWGDRAEPEVYDPYGNQVVVRYSNVEGGYGDADDHNIDRDPLFVDQDAENYHLLDGSPSIDAGLNKAPKIPKIDRDGKRRIVDGNGDGIARVDLGAYEYQR